MNALDVHQLLVDVLIVLAAGFVAGAVCRRLGVSLLVGYLVIGAMIGQGSLRLVSQDSHELELLAHTGALLLLFSVGIELSLPLLRRMSRVIVVGGSVQMVLVALPLVVVTVLAGKTWEAAFLVGAAGALSSTILVFKGLSEWGQTASPSGRRGIGLLLFQDIALVPLMLLVPLLTSSNDDPLLQMFGLLAGQSVLFLLAIVALRKAIGHWMVPLLMKLRSLELVVLFTLTVLGGVCWGTSALGLPSALGALAAGLVLGGNPLSKQIDTLSLPFRESFAAIFFVTLGTLLKPMEFFEAPLFLTGGLVAILLLKASSAAIALKLTGLSWKAAAGMGVGLAQLGEFSFLLLSEGMTQGVISAEVYNRMLFLAMGTLVLSPQLIKWGLRWAGGEGPLDDELEADELNVDSPVTQALVIGVGAVGRQVSSRLEMLGVDVCLIDQSPVNLHDYAQQGFHTIAGDARDPDVLRRARAAHCRLAIVCVPNDDAALQTVSSLRIVNRSISILVRCRYGSNVEKSKKLGANAVVCEERELSAALIRICQEVVESTRKADSKDA